MAKQTRSLLSLLIIGGTLSLIFIVSNGATRGSEKKDYYSTVSKNLKLLGRIYQEVSARYVDTVDPEEFLRAGINGMLNTLDPYTTYIEEREERHRLEVITQGRYGGVGILLIYRNNEVTVDEAPFIGTPAARAGIREGDVIVKVDSTLSRDVGFDETAKLIRGRPGTEVTLTIRREGEAKPLEFTLVREQIKIEDVRYSGILDNGIGYIRLTRFTTNAYDELSRAVRALNEKNIRGLVLDLRSNPGGLLDAAVKISDIFLPKGKNIVSTKGRANGTDQNYRSLSDPLYGNGPLVILVNRYSASASEIVAGAIQDNDRGVVLGDTTFGKGLVQSVIQLSPTSALRITTMKYYTPSGRCIQKHDYSAWTDTASIHTALFYTDTGRKVYSGGGIAPDLIVQYEPLNDIVIDMRRKSLFFNFAVHYVATHPSPASEIVIDDQIIEEFKAYLQDKSYAFRHPLERSLDELKQEARSRGYNGALLQDIDRLQGSLVYAKEDMFKNGIDDIKFFLKLELTTKTFGTTKGVEVSLEGDPVIQKALEVLNNQEKYASLLTTSE